MSSTSDELAYERVINRKYLQYVENKPEYPIYGVRKRPRNWGPLTGRVSFLQSGPDDDAEFYIGPQQAEWEGVEVVSWAAPAAQAFFGSERRWNGQYIRVRRRFNSRVDNVIGYADEWIMRKDTSPFPRPKRRRALARPDGSTVQSKASRPDPAERPIPSADELEAARLAESEQNHANRAEYLQQVMEAPRQDTLGPVLSTLQPEQYELVTADPTASLTVQGFAGTGKSIIATHRATWLTHPDREGPAVHDLLLVGPSLVWADHMEPAVRGLLAGDAWVETRTLGELIMDLLGLAPDYADSVSAWDVGPIITKFATHVIRDVVKDKYQKKNAPTIYAVLRARHLKLPSGATKANAEAFERLAKWQSMLPASYDEALMYPRLYPLLAYIHACLRPSDGYGHIIVDEAQDLRYLEWALLARLNRGAFTVLGDISQCRSQDGTTDWERVPAITGREPWPVVELVTGYRSTQSIMDFAGSLLPASAARRSDSILGSGTLPKVVNVKEEAHTLEVLALEQARLLSARHYPGSAAIISADLRRLIEVAKQRRWKREENETWRSPAGNKVRLLDADNCRGLEFDATVVIEPAAFRRQGRTYGELYTALTRANRELVVVHDQPLPAALARAVQGLAQ